MIKAIHKSTKPIEYEVVTVSEANKRGFIQSWSTIVHEDDGSIGWISTLKGPQPIFSNDLVLVHPNGGKEAINPNNYIKDYEEVSITQNIADDIKEVAKTVKKAVNKVVKAKSTKKVKK